ncbi:MAG: precorrin-2 C(20)-methyltransferase [Desulfobulbus propionicus]|nr:MAG: precorrin-2 C(20)-methyltransferase [Desulfobulbus propionicus]
MNEQDSTTQGRLLLVGVGPGDPELMTYRAVQAMADAPVWIGPKARENGTSSALAIASSKVAPQGHEVLELRFPMQKVNLGENVPQEVENAWRSAAAKVLARIDQGQDVAFPTLGDPGVYSTGFYLLATLQEQRPTLKVEIIPGITAMSACSAQLAQPLALGDDVLAVVPAAFDDDRLRRILAEHDVIVLMKVYRRLPVLVSLLQEMGLLENALLIERAGFADQRIYTNLVEVQDQPLHYFSTLLLRKRRVQLRSCHDV